MLIRSFGEPFGSPCALVLGGFDGLHAGHMSLLAEAKNTGLPIVLTTMYGGKGRELFLREERREIFSRAGIDVLIEIEFNEACKNTPAERFAGALFSEFDAKAVFCGEDFRFGKDACGTPELLRRLAPCPVAALPVKTIGGEKISASMIKQMLARGDMALSELLPFGYFVQGVVEHGREVGRTYGFPTLNLTPPPEKLLPPDGVYGGMCATPQGDYSCIVNLGARPTFGVEERKIEAYLDGFSGNLYGETVRVYPTERFRGVEKFPSQEALRGQLERDIQRLRKQT